VNFAARIRILLFYSAGFFILFVLFIPGYLSAKSYQFTHVHIDAKLMVDGSMEVTESRTFRFSGSFSYAFRSFLVSGSVMFADFRVSERGQDYSLSASRAPGTYSVVKSGRAIEIRWFFTARDETRTFDFHYRAKNAVLCYEDSAVLYYQFISREWEEPSRDVRLTLTPPTPLNRDRLNEWLHGPLWAESRIEDDGRITAWCERLPGRTHFEVRALYPVEIFPDAPSRSGSVSGKIMAEETRWVEEANKQREKAIRNAEVQKKRQDQGKWIAILLSFVGLSFAWRFYRKHGARPSVPPSMRFSSEIPARIPPALVGYLLGNREVYGTALVSTLLDLARRGYLILREEQVEKKRLFGGTKIVTEYNLDLKRDFLKANASKLEGFEDDLFQFIFDGLAGGKDSIGLWEIKKHQNKFRRFFQQWKKEVKEIGNRQGWFDRKSFRGMYYSLGIGSVMVILTGVAAFFFGIWAVILGGASVVVFVLSFLIPHRTREGEMLARGWKALRRYLQKYHYRAEDRSALLEQIDDYFVYGLVLGLGQKIYRELAGYIPSGDYATYMPWYVYHGTGSFSADAFASAFSSMVATTTSTVSTASGTGGGASGSGGGGASSGGGGAG
jgi:uncharacterized membrane protein